MYLFVFAQEVLSFLADYIVNYKLPSVDQKSFICELHKSLWIRASAKHFKCKCNTISFFHPLSDCVLMKLNFVQVYNTNVLSSCTGATEVTVCFSSTLNC